MVFHADIEWEPVEESWRLTELLTVELLCCECAARKYWLWTFGIMGTAWTCYYFEQKIKQ